MDIIYISIFTSYMKNFLPGYQIYDLKEAYDILIPIKKEVPQ